MAAMYPKKLEPLAKKIAWLMKKETGIYIDPEWISMMRPEPNSEVVIFTAQARNGNTTILCYSNAGKDFEVRTMTW